MLQRAIDINAWQVSLLVRIAQDLPEATRFTPTPGHGHPPVWILGHLIIVGEMGQQFLGKPVAHPHWLSLFGPGSSDKVATEDALSIAGMTDILVAEYATLRHLAATKGDPAILDAPHTVAFFADTPITTVGHLLELILTNHFGFHLAQLSAARRAAGFDPLV